MDHPLSPIICSSADTPPSSPILSRREPTRKMQRARVFSSFASKHPYTKQARRMPPVSSPHNEQDNASLMTARLLSRHYPEVGRIFDTFTALYVRLSMMDNLPESHRMALRLLCANVMRAIVSKMITPDMLAKELQSSRIFVPLDSQLRVVEPNRALEESMTTPLQRAERIVGIVIKSHHQQYLEAGNEKLAELLRRMFPQVLRFEQTAKPLSMATPLTRHSPSSSSSSSALSHAAVECV